MVRQGESVRCESENCLGCRGAIARAAGTSASSSVVGAVVLYEQDAELDQACTPGLSLTQGGGCC